MSGLTHDEMVVLDLLGEAAKAFFELPEHHPSDVQEFAHEMHILQHRVMSRAAVRWRPEYFTPLKGTP